MKALKYYLAKCLLWNKNTYKKYKITVFNTYFKEILVYGAEIWTIGDSLADVNPQVWKQHEEEEGDDLNTFTVTVISSDYRHYSLRYKFLWPGLDTL